MMSIVVAIANTLWPSQPPTGEVSGGVLKTYFQNIIGRCDGNKVLVAINKATGIKECANANSLISVANFGICPATNSYPKLYFTFNSGSTSSQIRLIWSSENTTRCSISGNSTTATGGSIDVPANGSSYTLSCSGADGSTVSQTMNTTSIGAVGGGIVWPTMKPIGEYTGGIFGNYLSNLGGEIGKCSSNEVIVGFEANGKPKCVVASSLMSAGSCPGSSDPYINFTATPSNVAPGDPVTLAWQAGNLTNCTTSDAFVVNGSSSGTALIHPTTTATYRITCSDDTGRQMQKSVSVTVTPPPIPGGWSSFGTCQTSCTKTRTCTNPTPQNGGLTCQNDAQGGATVSCYGGSCAPICGNGVQESGEVCDSGSNNGQPGHCNMTCNGVTNPICGNGVQESGEVCDSGSNNGQPGHCNDSCSAPTSCFMYQKYSYLGVTKIHIKGYHNHPICPLPLDLIIPSSVDGYPVVRIESRAFYNRGLTSVNFPYGLEGINSEAFSYNKLQLVTIPETVSAIGMEAFAYNEVSSVIFKPNTSSINRDLLIGKGAFLSNRLNSVIFSNHVTDIGDEAFFRNQLTSVMFGFKLKNIGNSAFVGNAITSLTIPNNVSNIGSRAFLGNQLTSVTIGNSVTSIGNHAFFNNKLTSVTIPNSVTSIGNNAFALNQLTSVTLSSSLQKIEESVFFGNQLDSIVIPSRVSLIEAGAFQNNKFTSIIIPNRVTSIGDRAFYGNQLTSVTIPSSVTSIGQWAFSYQYSAIGNGFIYGPYSGYVKNTYLNNPNDQFDKSKLPNYSNQ